MQIKLLKPPPGLHLILIEQRILGVKYQTIVDTGAELTAISFRLLNNLNLSEKVYADIDLGKMHGVGGIEHSPKVPIKMSFLGKTIPRDTVTVGLFLDNWRTVGFITSCDILLGMDILGQFNKVEFDFLQHLMILT